MILSQKYNSIQEIDPEFIPSLESLLSEKAPSIQDVLDYEKSAPENIQFVYYLFFGNQTNSPIGFAQIELKNEKEMKKSLFTKLLKKDPVEKEYFKSAKWIIPGNNQEGVTFSPKYIGHAKDSIGEVLKDLICREDIISQEICYSELYGEVFGKEESHKSIQILDSLVKNQQSYREYIQGLTPEVSKRIMGLFKKYHSEYKIGDYSSFKKMFEYKSNGAKQYKELRKSPQFSLKRDENIPTTYMTLEDHEEVKAIVLIEQGSQGNIFYSIPYFQEDIELEILHQLAIMKFYELDGGHKLHFQGSYESLEIFNNFGFTTRNQIILTQNKLMQ